MPLKTLLTIISLLIIFPTASSQERASLRLKKVVIDAGHGGRDPGAISPDGKVREKNITLSVALKLGELINKRYPDVEVIYTRKTNIFIPLDERTKIANRNKADLFISIHVNAAQSRAASGSETFVMGVNKTSSNLEVTMLENSVIMLEGDDYSTRYEGFNPNDPESYIVFSLLQNAHIEQSLLMASLVQKQFAKGPIKIDRGIKQGPLLVLWKTGMPGVLVELGFISNQNDLRILNDKKSHDKFAEGIFNAFEEYKNQYEKGYQNTSAVNDSSLSRTIEASLRDTSVSVKPSPQPSLQEHFRIQILAVSKILPSGAPDLKGRRDAKYIKAGNLYKYTIGEYKTVEEAKLAQDEIRRVFPQAFIIKVRNNTIVPLNN